MKEKLEQLVLNLQEELKTALKEADILNIKSKYLGKKSELNESSRTTFKFYQKTIRRKNY